MDKRTEYWNETYVKYWKDKVDAANDESKQDITEGDSKTENDTEAYGLFNKVEYHAGDKLLDFGCGFGRFWTFFQDKKQDYYGIDISQAMLDEFIRIYPEAKEKVQTSEGEKLPFADNTFKHIVCNGVFDACYQEQALEEMLRVCVVGGDIILTGKNNNYYEDDTQALIAERNARRKGHPNYFTDLHRMKQMLLDKGMEILYEKYELRREDMEKGISCYKEPKLFYTWSLIIKKRKQLEKYIFEKFSDQYSNTWNIVGMSD